MGKLLFIWFVIYFLSRLKDWMTEKIFQHHGERSSNTLCTTTSFPYVEKHNRQQCVRNNIKITMIETNGELIKMLEIKAHKLPKPQIQPLQFFIAWHGVLTLVIKRWPTDILQLKQEINDKCFPRQEENFGSKWPKVTLGALRTEVSFTKNDYVKLNTICNRFQSILNENTSQLIPLESLSIVMMTCRSLEHYLVRIDIPFKGIRSEDDSENNDSDSIVQSILQEQNEESYSDKVIAPGNRDSHYTSLWTESTLVSFIPSDSQLDSIIKDFQKEIDNAFPNYYRWVDRQSLHVTLRSLDARTGPKP